MYKMITRDRASLRAWTQDEERQEFSNRESTKMAKVLGRVVGRSREASNASLLGSESIMRILGFYDAIGWGK